MESETDRDRADRVHTASLRFPYPDRRRARTVERAVAVEVGEIPRASDIDADADAEGTTERSRAAVSRTGDAVELRVEAADLVALRAGVNTWTRLVSVAESVADTAATATADADAERE